MQCCKTIFHFSHLPPFWKLILLPTLSSLSSQIHAPSRPVPTQLTPSPSPAMYSVHVTLWRMQLTVSSFHFCFKYWFLYSLQTQPVPNPMSYFMHQSPEIFHKFETLTNHFIELVVPFFILLTRPFRIWCGILQILFQVSLYPPPF